MLTSLANGMDSRISLWLRVREFAVPPSMIESATARRIVGDWGGACAAAGFDVDINPRTLARTHGHELAARVRADLRHLAPDLLRWHMPRIAPDGLLRPGLTLTLARYRSEDGPRCDSGGPVHLVVRTAPAWADAGQRISLALWDESRSGGLHPHAPPDRRFRLDLHRHLWDARSSSDLRIRSEATQFDVESGPTPEFALTAPPGCAVDRWAAEAAELMRAEGGRSGPLLIRAGSRHRLVVELTESPNHPPALQIAATYPRDRISALPVLPDAATWTLPDLALLRAGAIAVARLHPLVAAALGPLPPPPEATADATRTDRQTPGQAPCASRQVAGQAPHRGRQATTQAPRVGQQATTQAPCVGQPVADGVGQVGHEPAHAGHAPRVGHGPSDIACGTRLSGDPRVVDCRGERHRIGLRDGVLTALDHPVEDVRREELLVALTGTPLPCLQAIDRAHRHPDCLPGVRERLRHGDIAGALAVVEDLLGPGASLREGALRDAFEAVAKQRITYGLFRAGLTGSGPPMPRKPRPPHRAHPRHAACH